MLVVFAIAAVAAAGAAALIVVVAVAVAFVAGVVASSVVWCHQSFSAIAAVVRAVAQASA